MRTFWTETYEQHFQHYFQKPFDVQVYHGPDGAGLKVATYDWAKARDYRVYASVGLADKLAEIEGEDFGEVVLFSRRCRQGDSAALCQCSCFFILHHDIPLGSRHFAIDFAAMAPVQVSRRYDKTSLYFTHPAEDDGVEVRQGAPMARRLAGSIRAFFISPQGSGVPGGIRFAHLRAGVLEAVQKGEQGCGARRRWRRRLQALSEEGGGAMHRPSCVPDKEHDSPGLTRWRGR